jgi:hypothetical protein
MALLHGIAYRTGERGEELRFRGDGVACHVYGAAVPGAIPLIRLFKPEGNYLHTTSTVKASDAVAKQGYTVDGVACYVPLTPELGSTALFRLGSSARDDHLYTTSLMEFSEAGYPLRVRGAGCRSIRNEHAVSGGRFRCTVSARLREPRDDVGFDLLGAPPGPPDAEMVVEGEIHFPEGLPPSQGRRFACVSSTSPPRRRVPSRPGAAAAQRVSPGRRLSFALRGEFPDMPSVRRERARGRGR